jgi:hypothetical protein
MFTELTTNRDRLDKEMLLERLTLLRGILNGEIDTKDCLLGSTGKNDGADRRTIALALVEEIGATIYESRKADEEAHEHPFGFAQWTQAGRKAA